MASKLADFWGRRPPEPNYVHPSYPNVVLGMQGRRDLTPAEAIISRVSRGLSAVSPNGIAYIYSGADVKGRRGSYSGRHYSENGALAADVHFYSSLADALNQQNRLTPNAHQGFFKDLAKAYKAEGVTGFGVGGWGLHLDIVPNKGATWDYPATDATAYKEIAGAFKNAPGAGEGGSPEEVQQIQQALAAAGFDPGPVDGEMGSKTKEALKAFQAASGLEADGIIGPQTIDALGKSSFAIANPGLAVPDAVQSTVPGAQTGYIAGTAVSPLPATPVPIVSSQDIPAPARQAAVDAVQTAFQQAGPAPVPSPPLSVTGDVPPTAFVMEAPAPALATPDLTGAFSSAPENVGQAQQTGSLPAPTPAGLGVQDYTQDQPVGEAVQTGPDPTAELLQAADDDTAAFEQRMAESKERLAAAVTAMPSMMSAPASSEFDDRFAAGLGQPEPSAELVQAAEAAAFGPQMDERQAALDAAVQAMPSMMTAPQPAADLSGFAGSPELASANLNTSPTPVPMGVAPPMAGIEAPQPPNITARFSAPFTPNSLDLYAANETPPEWVDPVVPELTPSTTPTFAPAAISTPPLTQEVTPEAVSGTTPAFTPAPSLTYAPTPASPFQPAAAGPPLETGAPVSLPTIPMQVARVYGDVASQELPGETPAEMVMQAAPDLIGPAFDDRFGAAGELPPALNQTTPPAPPAFVAPPTAVAAPPPVYAGAPRAPAVPSIGAPPVEEQQENAAPATTPSPGLVGAVADAAAAVGRVPAAAVNTVQNVLGSIPERVQSLGNLFGGDGDAFAGPGFGGYAQRMGPGIYGNPNAMGGFVDLGSRGGSMSPGYLSASAQAGFESLMDSGLHSFNDALGISDKAWGGYGPSNGFGSGVGGLF